MLKFWALGLFAIWFASAGLWLLQASSFTPLKNLTASEPSNPMSSAPTTVSRPALIDVPSEAPVQSEAGAADSGEVVSRLSGAAPLAVGGTQSKSSHDTPVAMGASSVSPHPARPSVSESTVVTPLIRESQSHLTLMFLPSQTSKTLIKRALARLVLSPTRPKASELLARTALNIAQKPYYFERIVDHEGQPIRYPAQAYRFAEHLLAHQGQAAGQGEEVRFQIPLEPVAFVQRAQAFSHAVRRHAQRFEVAPALIYAVMEVESHFNPKAVSPSNAIGLMQLKPEAAGKDVYQVVDAKNGQPTRTQLYDPNYNIRMGTAYLWLLRDVYLQAVMDERSREMLVIAAYNGGIQTLFDLFAGRRGGREQAIASINQLSAKQIYRVLRYQHPFSETRQYLDKVMQAKNRYQSMLLAQAQRDRLRQRL